MATNHSPIRAKEDWTRIQPHEVECFFQRCLEAAGSKPAQAQAVAELLVCADYRGHYSHGLNKLEMYLRSLRAGVVSNDSEPEVLKETVATAWVHGHNAPGPIVGKFCIDLAIQKAKDVGIGWVVAKGSNHFGIAGWYGMRAAKHGFIGMAFTNTSPWMVPTRAKQKFLGSNPLAMAAPSTNGDSFVLDMATTAVALGKVELTGKQGQTIPNGWGCNVDGQETNDPSDVLKDGGLLPLGGTEESGKDGGYKGYGLGMMVELFCGILGGATVGPNIRRWGVNDKVADLGQCFVAINPECFAPGFSGRMEELLQTCRNLPTVDDQLPVLVPGDPEREHMASCDQLGGIPYHPNQMDRMAKLSQELGVQPVIIVN